MSRFVLLEKLCISRTLCPGERRYRGYLNFAAFHSMRPHPGRTEDDTVRRSHSAVQALRAGDRGGQHVEVDLVADILGTNREQA